MKKIAALLIATAMTASPTVAFAKKNSHGYSKAHAAKKARGETCWRTNRHTGQRFRIC